MKTKFDFENVEIDGEIMAVPVENNSVVYRYAHFK